VNKKQERIKLLERQIERLRLRADALIPLSNRYSWSRVAIFFIGLALSVLLVPLVAWWAGLTLFIVTVVAFSVVAHYHRKIDRGIAGYTLWMHIKEAHVARMKLDWEHIPSVEEPTARSEHPFEFDLDITGLHSIHRLLNTAISREGSQRLLDWLLQIVPDGQVIERRQALVRELAPLTRFRDRLILNSLQASGRRSEQHLEGQRLLRWLDQRGPTSALRPLLVVSTALNILTVLLLLLWTFAFLPSLWIYSAIAAAFLFFATGNARGDIFEDATYLRYGFRSLKKVFSYLETYPYSASVPRLKALCEPFYTQHASTPTALLKGTARISSAATLKNNGLLWILVNAFVPWDLYCAYKLDRYKDQLSKRLPVWLDTWYELEAVCSLASFAYLNPEYTLPEVVPCALAEREPGALFNGSAMGHPLIAVEQKVTNSFAFNELGEVVIITGSNMAGKSTFLRTLGVNLCLAYAGAPVNAERLQTSLFRLFTCIRVTDSVTDGYSYFYAEVRRLHALLEAQKEPGQLPLFFLVDEIFKGTNNRERLIGSRSFVKALVGCNCVGLISTHDLELANLALSIAKVRNNHFREEVLDGQMVFDYILREGPCPTTNALKIMAMEGLPTDG
jgi:ABC-type multidrug transport system fused ATPase/permease subunit